MKLYISGPMTGIASFNFPAFECAAGVLREQGHDVLSAHEVDHGEKITGGLPWTTYLRGDLRAMLVECDAIVLLHGWPKSRGARLELDVALALEMKVYYYDASCGLIDLTEDCDA